jgi:hypothetical protein
MQQGEYGADLVVEMATGGTVLNGHNGVKSGEKWV